MIIWLHTLKYHIFLWKKAEILAIYRLCHRHLTEVLVLSHIPVPVSLDAYLLKDH